MIDADKMEDQAIRLLESDKLRRAERVLQKMLALDRNSIAAHFHLARVYRRTEQYEIALHHAHRTLRLNPNEQNAHLNLGLIYDLMGKDKLAAFHYKKELSRNSGSAETLWNIGRLHFENHRWLEASKYLRRCYNAYFMFQIEDTVHKLGFCYYKLRDLQSYIDVYTDYVRIAPEASWAYANLGCALLRAKDYKHAVLRLKRAAELGIKKSIAVELARAKKMLRRQ
jgi:Tfp pilus assembly protein PilF